MTTSPRVLIWTVALGSYKEMGHDWLTSLRHLGQSKKDVVVLSDVDSGSGSTRYVNVLPMLGYDPDAVKSGHCSVKPFIQFLEGVFSKYDFLFYNDADVLIGSNRVDAILDQVAMKNEIVVQRDLMPISSGRKWTGVDLLTPEEREKYKDDSICAGIFGVPVSDLGTSLLKDWHALNKAAGYANSDQKRLVTLLLRKYAGQWSYLPETCFGIEKRKWDASTWTHFTSQQRHYVPQFWDHKLKVSS